LTRQIPALALCVGLLCCHACSRAEDDTGPHERIVLITVDTLRHDAFAGNARGAGFMPQLRELASNGLVFDRHFSSTSTTQPTHASLLTGLHPWQHGVLRNGIVLADEHATLAEILSAEGFWSAAAVASFPVTAQFGFDRGFDRFDEELGLGKGARGGEHDGELYRLADDVTERALGLLADAPSADQFLWVHYFDPHAPYGDTGTSKPLRMAALKTRANRDDEVDPLPVERMWHLYGEDVGFVDRHLSRLIETLLADPDYRTHVIVTADHGEILGENGKVGHGNDVSEEEVHVPLLILSPTIAPAHRDDPCGSVDLFATVLALAGVDADAQAGRNLLEPSPGNVPVLGMRRTYEEPDPEARASDWRPAVEGHRFYLLDGESMVRGNGEAVSVEGKALDLQRQQGVRDLFSSFERALESLDSEEILNLDAQRALEALGYVR
jgi:arylsulfatase A-like enzyme